VKVRYPLEYAERLGPAPALCLPSPRLGDWLRLLVTLPLASFQIVYCFGRALLQAPDLIEVARRKQHLQRWDEARARGWVRHDQGEARLVLNRVALSALIQGIQEQLRDAPGWHAHSDMFCSLLPIDLTFGDGPGPLELRGATHLFADRANWERVLDHWSQCLEEGPCLLILDRDQQGWCSPQSQGRLWIELRDDLDPYWCKLDGNPVHSS